MEVNKKQLADIFGASIRTIQNWQEQGMSGTLVSRTRALQPYSGMTGYNGIIARLQQAASDPMVDGILLDMDTPGGMVAGAFDCADIIARVRDIKPVPAIRRVSSP